jgi:quercetin dioxygenase-like cupin family protein
VESGTLAVLVERSSPGPALLLQAPVGAEPRPPTPLAPGTEVVLTPGQLLILPDAVTGLARGRGGAPAVVSVVTMTVPDVTGDTPGETGDGAAPELIPRVLAGDLLATFPPSAVTVSIGRATLPPGGALPPHAVAGAELLIVEAGTLTLATSGEPAWVRRGATGRGTAVFETTLTAGDGAHVPADAVSTLRNAGADPLVVLVVIVTPVDAWA